MTLLQSLLQKLKEKREEAKANVDVAKQYEAGQRIMERYEQKKLSANERELIRHYQEEREKQIKAKLEAIRRAKMKRTWSGRENNAVYAPNIVKDNKKLFRQKLLFSRNERRSRR